MPITYNNDANISQTGIVVLNNSTFTGTTTTQYNVLCGGAANSIANVAPSSNSGIPLISQGSMAFPAFGAVIVQGGGSGVASFSPYDVICGGTTSTGPLQQVSGEGTSGYVLTSNGANTLPTWKTNGASAPSGTSWSSSSNTALPSFYEQSLVGLKSCTTYNGSPNPKNIRLTSVSFSNSELVSSGITFQCNFRLSATVNTPSPTFTPISGSTSNNGTTITSGSSVSSVSNPNDMSHVTGGTVIYSFSMGADNSVIINLIPYNLIVSAATILTFSSIITGATLTQNTCPFSINWVEY
jgi:hypothetical protein